MTGPIDLRLYTDGAAMRALLQSQLPGFAEGRLRIDALAVRSVRRNTSQQRNPRPMTLSYELSVSEPAGGRSGTQLLYAEVYRNGGAAAMFARHERGPLTAPAFGEPLVHLPALHLLLWALPNDPGLPQLTTLLDPVLAAQVLPGAAGAQPRVELLRYEPQQRATLRYRQAAADGCERTVYAKTFCDERAAAIDLRFKHFWQRAQEDGAAPLVAQPLGHDAATRTVWQAPALGVPLRLWLDHPDAPQLTARVACALACLHDAPLAATVTAAPRSAAHWLAEVQRRSRKVSRADTALAPRAERVANAIEGRAGAQRLRPLTLIHGDFHPEQVWLQNGRVLLFDFDEFTLGDPMEDVAEFVVKLEQEGASPALTLAFIDGYAAAAPARFDRASLAWHLAIQSLLQVSRAFIYQQPGWARALAQRLAACEARAAALSPECSP